MLNERQIEIALLERFNLFFLENINSCFLKMTDSYFFEEVEKYMKWYSQHQVYLKGKSDFDWPFTQNQASFEANYLKYARAYKLLDRE